ncbi:MAG TPA: polyprenol phosphomannose-dependent alpha 1,6 mannosyltransferase MptB [Solirubrobacterales bacterium]|nr:polyprenol phosphomannose-dependent alpha 1,6 mannosyltransferase MptB [Solirubrobacterales bacterium]
MSGAATYALLWAGFLAYLGALAKAPVLGRRAVWGAVLLALVIFAAVPPLLSQDVYSYVDYARLGVVHDLNPYVHPPSAAPADPVYAEVGWTEATSAYGPLFTLMTYPLAWLPVDVGVYLLKAHAAASLLGLAVLVARLAPTRGIDPLRAAAFVALNPLVLVHVVGGGHNDAAAMLLAMLGVAAVLSGREGAAGVAFVASWATKATAALAAPFALIATPRRDRLVLGALGASLAIGIAGYAAFGWHWIDSLGLAGENQGRVSNYSIPNLLSEALNLDIDLIRAIAIAAYLGFLTALLLWVRRGADWLRAAAWATLGLLLATAWLLPWYLIWALPYAALSRDRVLQLLVLALTALQLAARVPL